LQEEVLRDVWRIRSLYIILIMNFFCSCNCKRIKWLNNFEHEWSLLLHRYVFERRHSLFEVILLFLFLFFRVCFITRLRVSFASLQAIDIKKDKWHSWKWTENDTRKLISQQNDCFVVFWQKFFHILINWRVLFCISFRCDECTSFFNKGWICFYFFITSLITLCFRDFNAFCKACM
jgi:hypothetical protein